MSPLEYEIRGILEFGEYFSNEQIKPILLKMLKRIEKLEAATEGQNED